MTKLGILGILTKSLGVESGRHPVPTNAIKYGKNMMEKNFLPVLDLASHPRCWLEFLPLICYKNIGQKSALYG